MEPLLGPVSSAANIRACSRADICTGEAVSFKTPRVTSALSVLGFGGVKAQQQESPFKTCCLQGSYGVSTSAKGQCPEIDIFPRRSLAAAMFQLSDENRGKALDESQ